MYTLVEATCLSRSIGAQWRVIDIEDNLVSDIFMHFSSVFLKVGVLGQINSIIFNIEQFRTQYSNSSLTLGAWLKTLANVNIVTTETAPSANVSFVKYSDIYKAGYKANVHSAKDVKITRPNIPTNLNLIHSHCLVSVNGYIHNTSFVGDDVVVNDAVLSMTKCNENHIGLLSFLDVGRLTRVKLNSDTISIENNVSVLNNKITFTVTESLVGKSLFLVLGGYLIFLSEGVFWRDGITNKYILDLNRTPFIQRFYESNLYLNLSSLGLITNPINKDMINVEELWSDVVIKRYLTMSQSFLVIVDKPNLMTNKIHIRSCNMPGLFTAYQEPTYPLIVNYGKIAEYWKTYDDENQWSLSVADSFMRNYILSERPISQLPNVTKNLLPETPTRFSNGYLLEIAGY